MMKRNCVIEDLIMSSRYIKNSVFFLFVFISTILYLLFFSATTKDNWQRLHHQAHMALHDEKYEYVIETCDKAIQSTTSSANKYTMYIKKTTALNKLHRYEEGLESANLAVKLYPKKEAAYLVKVDSLFNLEKEDELIGTLEEIILINPRTPFKHLLNSLRIEHGKTKYE